METKVSERCEAVLQMMSHSNFFLYRCRSELGVQGRLCEHCKLDELQVWLCFAQDRLVVHLCIWF